MNTSHRWQVWSRWRIGITCVRSWTIIWFKALWQQLTTLWHRNLRCITRYDHRMKGRPDTTHTTKRDPRVGIMLPATFLQKQRRHANRARDVNWDHNLATSDDSDGTSYCLLVSSLRGADGLNNSPAFDALIFASCFASVCARSQPSLNLNLCGRRRDNWLTVIWWNVLNYY